MSNVNIYKLAIQSTQNVQNFVMPGKILKGLFNVV